MGPDDSQTALKPYRPSAGSPRSSSFYWLALATLVTFTGSIGFACWDMLKKHENPSHSASSAAQSEKQSGDGSAAEQEHSFSEGTAPVSSRLRQGIFRSQDSVSETDSSLERRVSGIEEEAAAAPSVSFAGLYLTPGEYHEQLRREADRFDLYSDIRALLHIEGVDPALIPDPDSIRHGYSHLRVLPEDGRDTGMRVVAKWFNYEIDGRTESHLYALVEDEEERLVTLHWFLCNSRDTSRVMEDCLPLLSIYSQDSDLVSVGYYRNGTPRMPSNIYGPSDPSVWSEKSIYTAASTVLAVIADRNLSLTP